MGLVSTAKHKVNNRGVRKKREYYDKNQKCLKLIILYKYFLYFFCYFFLTSPLVRAAFVMHWTTARKVCFLLLYFLFLSPSLFVCVCVLVFLRDNFAYGNNTVCVCVFVCSDFIGIIIFCPPIFKLLLFDSIKVIFIIYKLND